MAPCSGKPKCGCGCPKKKKAVKRKAVQKRKPAPQRGSAVIQTFPGMIQPQFTPSLLTPIPSAVSKVSGDNIVKRSAEIATQTEDIRPRTAEIATQTEKKVRPETIKKLKKILETPVAPVEKPAARALSKSAIAAINRSQSARPIERVGNIVSFAPVDKVEDIVPIKVEDIQPRKRGRPPGKKALGETVSRLSQPLITSLLQAPQN